MKKLRILSLDGGGIRGIIPATILKYVEEKLQEAKPGSRLADHFDFVAGTSTGAILAALYLTPNKPNSQVGYTAADALDFYIDNGYDIFNASKIKAYRRGWGLFNATEYSPKTIERLFKETFEDKELSELIKPALFTTYSMQMKQAFFFSTEDPVEHRKFYIRDVLRSTSAAPSYFPPAAIENFASNPRPLKDPTKKMYNLDGGVFANNPTMCAYAEVRNLDFPSRGLSKPKAEDMLILSIGTGGGGFTLDQLEKSNSWGIAKWARRIPEIMMDGAIDSVAFQMNELMETVQNNNPNGYLRVDFPKGMERPYDSDMANAARWNIENLQQAGQLSLEHYKTQIDSFLEKLLD